MYYLKKDVLPMVYWDGLLRYAAFMFILIILSRVHRGWWGGPGAMRRVMKSGP